MSLWAVLFCCKFAYFVTVLMLTAFVTSNNFHLLLNTSKSALLWTSCSVVHITVGHISWFIIIMTSKLWTYLYMATNIISWGLRAWNMFLSSTTLISRAITQLTHVPKHGRCRGVFNMLITFTFTVTTFKNLLYLRYFEHVFQTAAVQLVLRQWWLC